MKIGKLKRGVNYIYKKDKTNQKEPLLSDYEKKRTHAQLRAQQFTPSRVNERKRERLPPCEIVVCLLLLLLVLTCDFGLTG